MIVYLTIPLSLPGDEKQGNDDKTVPGKILPAHVIAYHEGYAWGTFIYLTTGQAFLTPLTVAEYELRVRQYWEEVGKNAVGKAMVKKLLQ